MLMKKKESKMLKLFLITKCNQNRNNERWLAKKKVLLNLEMIAVKGIMRDYEYGKMVIIIYPLSVVIRMRKVVYKAPSEY